MTRRRISLNDLAPGQVLAWDLYGGDTAAAPILHQGQPAPDGPQLRRLLESGLFADEPAAPSVLHLLNRSNQRLERLLLDLRSQDDAEHEVRHIAAEVLRAAELDPDIALASIFLNQINGTYAVRHCIETALLVSLVARGMDKSLEETLIIGSAALTMNVGMLRHHDSFQLKRTPLTREEMEIVRRHPEQSAELLKCAGVDDEEWISCVMLHHENDDGSGYPDGKTSDDITQNAKLIGLADRYCARVSARNYRRSILPDQALQHLFLDQRLAVDPMLAEQFVRQLGKYPPGSLVRLHNGEVGVVTTRQGSDGGIPVRALRDASGMLIPDTVLRSTGDPAYAIAEALHEDEAGLRFSMKNVWGEQASL